VRWRTDISNYRKRLAVVRRDEAARPSRQNVRIDLSSALAVEEAEPPRVLDWFDPPTRTELVPA
jgi:hypothetical protein